MTLTERERAVLAAVAAGRTSLEIARLLGVSQSTVKNHLTHIFEKLRVSTRAQAVWQAYQLGLLDLDAPASTVGGVGRRDRSFHPRLRDDDPHSSDSMQ